MAATTINLPNPNVLGKMSVEESILRRRSERSYQDKDLSDIQLSQLLWSAQGITDTSYGFRAAPSAGSLYPIQIYVAKKDGIYRYIPDGHKLAQISKEDKRATLVRAALGQSFIQEAPVAIVLAANFRNTEANYGPRAFRYICMEAGHIAENVHLQAVAMGLVSVPVGAFWDDVIKANLELPEAFDPIYIIPVGHLKT